MREVVLYEILLDLHKSYDSLDRDRHLGILEGYGAGPRAIQLLCPYWLLLTMVTMDREYHDPPFKGFH